MKKLKYVFLSTLWEERILSIDTQNKLHEFSSISNSSVKKWIKTYLASYLLHNFDDRDPDVISDKNGSFKLIYSIGVAGKLVPATKYKSYELDTDPKGNKKLLYEIQLSQDSIILFENLIKYLNTLNIKNLKWSVPFAIKKYKESSNKNLVSEKVLLKLRNGYICVELLDRASLEKEGKRMQNCLGTERIGHIKDVIENRATVLSLRKNNNPHVNIKYRVDSKLITDIYGKQNKFPLPEYIDYIIEIIEKLGLKISKNYIDTLIIKYKNQYPFITKNINSLSRLAPYVV